MTSSIAYHSLPLCHGIGENKQENRHYPQQYLISTLPGGTVDNDECFIRVLHREKECKVIVQRTTRNCSRTHIIFHSNALRRQSMIYFA
jgi:hypothetical protein